MKKLLILETNSNIANAQIIEAARAKGIYTIVSGYTPKDKSVVKRMADESWDISTSDFDSLVAKCREVGVDGFFGGTDYAVDVSISLSEALGASYYCDADTWHYSRNKVDFKARCREYGVPVVPEIVLDPEDDLDIEQIELPAVVKPCDRSGNVGVSFCYSEDELRTALAGARDKAENGKVLIEKYMTGMEYTPFYVLANGEPRLLYLSSMLSEKGMPTNCYTVSTTLTSEEALNKYLKEIDPEVRELLKGIGCRDGVAWLELMTDSSGNYYAIEMGHRLSGEMLWASMPGVRDFSAVDWMLDYAVDGYNSSDLLPSPLACSMEKNGCGYILWTKKSGAVVSIEGLEKVAKTLDATVHQVAKIGTQIDEHQYALIVSFASSSPEKLCENLRFINETVSMKDADGNELLSFFTGFDSILSM